MMESLASSSVELPPQHQVFVNFRGKQLRNNFVSHLEKSLEYSGIKVFIDNKETKGKDLTILLNRIEESKVALVIFSSMYADSRWCLDELVKIRECVDLGKLVVIPIYYKVETDNVRNLMGEFGHNFWELAKTCRGENIDEWMAALKDVTYKMGITVSEMSNESECISQIVGQVREVLYEIFKDRERVIPIDKPLNGRDIIMASSSSSSLQPPQIFINFRGEELRNGFVSYLVRALKRDEINVYMDENETRGEDLSVFFKRIEESRIALAVISSQYTESRWCLDELVKIMECVDAGQLVVIPIFYKVETDDVQNLEGEFGYKFWKLAKTCIDGNIDKWRKALNAVTQKLGLKLGENSDKGKFLDQIVGEVKRVLLLERFHPSTMHNKRKRSTS